MARDITFTFNGNRMAARVEDYWTLLHFIREPGYTGTKEVRRRECGPAR
jgi:aerobic-type carbon monoxide dehydrogenase small subunit (CoxS/CutS family)